MNKNNTLTVAAAMLLGVAAVYAYADHAQVTVSITPADENMCMPLHLCITPSYVTLDIGGEIIWINDGTAKLSIEGDNNAIGSRVLEPGQSYSLKFDTAGEYRYMLETHPWITGVITVVGDHEHDDHSDSMATHSHGTIQSAVPLGLSLHTAVDDEGGITIMADTAGWLWAPENVNKESADGEGHAHVYVNGEKTGRIYGSYHYIDPMDPGTYQIRVTLNTNDHNELTSDGILLEALDAVLIPERNDNMDSVAPSPVSGTPGMAVSAIAHTDALGGFNLQLNVTDFELTGANVDEDHVQGQGYARLYVDDEYLARIYETWHNLSGMEPGMHTITVALFTNDHAPYHLDGKHMSVTITVDVPGGMEDSHGHKSHGH